jgi:hypothetical protein
MRLQKIHLLLQLLRIRPVIIPLAEGDILAPALEPRVCALKFSRGTAMDLDVVLPTMQKKPDFVGMALGVFLAYLPCPVVRLIFTDQYFDRKIGLLHEHAVETVVNKIGVLIGTYLDGYHRLRDSLPCVVRVLFYRSHLVLPLKVFKV